MGGVTGRSRRPVIVLVLTAALVGSLLVPARAATGDRSDSPIPGNPVDLGIRLEMVRQLKRLGAPRRITDLLTRRDAGVQTAHYVEAWSLGDVTADGVDEVVEIEISYTLRINEGQDLNQIVVEEPSTTFWIRDGRSGKRYWKRHYDDLVIPVRAVLGEPARPGVLVVGGLLSFFMGSTGERYLSFDALRGPSGKRLWNRTYRSVGVSADLMTQVTTDSPVSIHLFQGHKGAADELLLGLGDFVETTFTTTVVTRTVVIDGSNGAETLHPSLDVGVDWIPYPSPVSDIDSDGLQDYVVINNRGFHPGEGQDPPTIGGLISARKGVDGSPLWTSGGHIFLNWALVMPLPDVVGGGPADFAISTYSSKRIELLPMVPVPLPISSSREFPVAMLVDGSQGRVPWVKPADWAFSPGKLDGDGVPDVVLERFRRKGATSTYTQIAHRGTGEKIWEHQTRVSFESCLADGCLRLVYALAFETGDVQPDQVSDTFLMTGIIQDPGADDEVRYIIDGDSGRVLIRSDSSLHPALLAVDGDGADVVNSSAMEERVSIRARTGSGGKTLWRTTFTARRGLLPEDRYAGATGVQLSDDRCGDILINVALGKETYFAVLSGSAGRVVWDDWTGPRADRPRVASISDLNPAC